MCFTAGRLGIKYFRFTVNLRSYLSNSSKPKNNWFSYPLSMLPVQVGQVGLTITLSDHWSDQTHLMASQLVR